MIFEITYQLRVFPVEITDSRTGERSMDRIALDRRILEDARQIGMNHETLIWRLYNQKGYYVRRIGKAIKQEAHVDLTALYDQIEEKEVNDKIEQLRAELDETLQRHEGGN